MNKINITYGRQFIDSLDIRFVKKSLEENLITTGNYVKKFEDKIKNVFKVKYVISCSSGTAALHLAAKSISPKKNDIIILPVVNFVAVSNIFKECSDVKIYYADVDPISGQLTPKTLLDCIKKNKINKLKAFFTMYLGGSAKNIEEFYKIKKKYKCFMIEDACHALGARYKIKQKYFKIGSCKHADISIFSLHPLKTITTGEGGVLTTNNKKIYASSKLFRSHGIKRKNNHWNYDVINFGLNYRLSDINCSLGFSQLLKLNKFLKKRKSIAKYYFKNISKLKNLTFSDDYSDLSAWHLFRVQIDFKKLKFSKQDFFKLFLKKGIMLQQHYIPLFKFTAYKNLKGRFSGAEKYFESSISLPIYYSLKNNELFKITKTLKEILKK
jgi:dTDP-4-amino-4,6-dideoxygalactose transaminase